VLLRETDALPILPLEGRAGMLSVVDSVVTGASGAARTRRWRGHGACLARAAAHRASAGAAHDLERVAAGATGLIGLETAGRAVV